MEDDNMNSFARSALVLLAGAAALSCTACSQTKTHDNSGRSENLYTTAYELIGSAGTGSHSTGTATLDSSIVAMDPIFPGSFRTAVWLGKDKQMLKERYFLFLDDTHGKMIDQQNGQETAFTYSVSEGKATLQVGAQDGLSGTAIWTDENNVILRWSDNQTEFLSFLNENSKEPLHNFTNEQLCTMAQEHYSAQYGNRPPHVRAFYNVDDMISLQLFDGDGAASDTFIWYTVDRFTGEGYNSLNEPISLTNAQAGTAPAQTTTAVTETTVPETTVPETTAAPEPTTLPPVKTVAETLPPVEPPATEPPTEPVTPIDNDIPDTAAGQDW